MVPFGLKESQFFAHYRDLLDSTSDAAVELLRALLARPLEAGVDSAEVEVFLGEYGAAPDLWMYFHGKSRRVSRSDPSLFPGRSLPLSLDLSTLSEFDEQYFEAQFPGCDLAANAIKAWFSACWHEAGGATYRVPVTLAVHDGFGDGKVVVLCKGDG